MRLLSAVLLVLLATGLGFLMARGHMGRSPDAASSRRILYWIDPMHPAYKSDHPGTAPDCGMALEPVYANSLPAEMPATAGVKGSRGRAAISSIAVVKAERSSERGDLKLSGGRVVADETRVYTVNAGVDGFVKETHGDGIGDYVRKDQRLATIYSPEFLTILGGYLSASERIQNTASREMLATNQSATGVENWADRLRNLGVSDAQIAELKESRKIPEDIYVVSPVNGFIVSRSLAANERFERHTEFYRIADLSHVWILVNISSDELAYCAPGTAAWIAVPDLGKKFQARVSDALPQIDPVSRIATLRLEADNRHFDLRPEMFVNAELALSPPPAVTVPQEAVMNSGAEKRVFVELADGSFQPRQVETGPQVGSRVSIIHGLAEGERVVVDASFLLDSETPLNAWAFRSGEEQSGQNRRAVARAENIAASRNYQLDWNSERRRAFSHAGGDHD